MVIPAPRFLGSPHLIRKSDPTALMRQSPDSKFTPATSLCHRVQRHKSFLAAWQHPYRCIESRLPSLDIKWGSGAPQHSCSSTYVPEMEALLRVPRGRNKLCCTRDWNSAETIGCGKGRVEMPMAWQRTGDGLGSSLGAATGNVLVLSFIEVKRMSCCRRDAPSLRR